MSKFSGLDIARMSQELNNVAGPQSLLFLIRNGPIADGTSGISPYQEDGILQLKAAQPLIGWKERHGTGYALSVLAGAAFPVMAGCMVLTIGKVVTSACPASFRRIGTPRAIADAHAHVRHVADSSTGSLCFNHSYDGGLFNDCVQSALPSTGHRDPLRGSHLLFYPPSNLRTGYLSGGSLAASSISIVSH
jgi:hypothetical protein